MNRTLRTREILAAAIALIAVSVALSVTGTAQAYDSATCNGLFPGNVSRTARIYINDAHADFGDHMHILGVPRGDAVICWGTDGRVAVKGILFSDPGPWPHNDNQWATARITFIRANGTSTPGGMFSTALSNSLKSGIVTVSSPVGNFTRVRIQLSFTNESGAETLYQPQNFNR